MLKKNNLFIWIVMLLIIVGCSSTGKDNKKDFEVITPMKQNSSDNFSIVTQSHPNGLDVWSGTELIGQTPVKFTLYEKNLYIVTNSDDYFFQIAKIHLSEDKRQGELIVNYMSPIYKYQYWPLSKYEVDDLDAGKSLLSIYINSIFAEPISVIFPKEYDDFAMGTYLSNKADYALIWIADYDAYFHDDICPMLNISSTINVVDLTKSNHNVMTILNPNTQDGSFCLRRYADIEISPVSEWVIIPDREDLNSDNDIQYIVNMKNSDEIFRVTGKNKFFSSCAWKYDELMFACTTETNLEIFSFQENRLVSDLEIIGVPSTLENQRKINEYYWSGDNIVIESEDRILIFDSFTGEKIADLQGEKVFLLSEDGRYIITMDNHDTFSEGNDVMIYLYDIENGETFQKKLLSYPWQIDFPSTIMKEMSGFFNFLAGYPSEQISENEFLTALFVDTDTAKENFMKYSYSNDYLYRETLLGKDSEELSEYKNLLDYYSKNDAFTISIIDVYLVN